MAANDPLYLDWLDQVEVRSPLKEEITKAIKKLKKSDIDLMQLKLPFGPHEGERIIDVAHEHPGYIIKLSELPLKGMLKEAVEEAATYCRELVESVEDIGFDPVWDVSN